MAQAQLALLEAPPDWQLDEQTKAVGRRGIAQARAALEAAIHRRNLSATTRGEGAGQQHAA